MESNLKDGLSLFDIIILLSKTPAQVQAPSRVDETKGASQQWYHREKN